MFFGCFIISGHYLFEELVLLNPCFIFSKNLILSLTDKVTTGTKIFNVDNHKIYFCFIIMMLNQYTVFFPDKSSSISQFINVKSRSLQKLLRYLSWIVTSTFKVGTASLFTFPSFPGCGGVFPTIFVLYLNDLPS